MTNGVVMYNNIKRFVWIFRISVTCIVIFECVAVRFHSPWMQLASIGGMLLLVLNDILRNHYGKLKSGWIASCSFVVSIIGAGLYAFWLNTLPASIFFLFPLIEIFLGRDKISYPLLVLYSGIFIVENLLLNDLSVNNLVTYVSIVVVMYLYKNNVDQRQKTNSLNESLITANQQLTEYAQKVGQIAAVNERTRIAQDLHDSIGHGLIALSMNLEFIERAADKDNVKIADAAAKAHTLSIKCISDLRSAVHILKVEKICGEDLKAKLTEMIENVRHSGIKISLAFEGDIENICPDLEDCIYKSVREAVTNSIKNGKAYHIRIELKVSGTMLTLSVEDDGIGCKMINKSHGLSGIEKRLENFGGKAEYNSEEGKGFLLRIQIPLEDDKEI